MKKRFTGGVKTGNEGSPEAPSEDPSQKNYEGSPPEGRMEEGKPLPKEGEEAPPEEDTPLEEEEGEFAEEVRCAECGSRVVKHETPTATNYRCPACKRLVKVVKAGGEGGPPSNEGAKPSPGGISKKVNEEPEGGESEGLAKSATDRLLYELEKNMETFNVPGTGKAGREKRKRIIAVLEKAPAYREWQHVHSLLDTAGVSPTDAKAICDMTFSQVSQEDLKRETGQAQEVAAEGKELRKEESLDDHLKKTMDRLTMAKMIKNMGSEDMGEIAKETTDEDIDKLLKTMMNRQMMLQMVKSLQSGWMMGSDSKKNPSTEDIIRIIEERERMKEEKLTKEDIIKILDEREKKKESSLTKDDIAKIIEEYGNKSGGGLSEARLLQLLDERDQQKSEEKEKTTLMQTLDGVRQALDNLHGRVSTIEKGGISKKDEDGIDKKMLDATVNKFLRSMERGELTEDRVRSIMKESAPKPSAPPGSRSEYDMEVEKAMHNAEARKIEAEEKRKGYEAIAGGIRDGFASLGWNIGAGASGGTVRSEPSSTAQTGAGAPATETQPMEWRDGFWYTRCVYSDCRAPMAFEDGRSTVMCPTCHRVIQVQPTEEELKRKVSVEKRTETTAEVKKEEPKREGKKPPEAEKPESVEEKPSAEAKPEVPKASEGSDAKDTKEAQGTTS